MEEYLHNPAEITTKAFIRICSGKLKDYVIQQWRTAVSNEYSKSGQRNYALFKTAFEMEPYLTNVNDFKMRKCICKFRCSDHKLEIELGRQPSPK